MANDASPISRSLLKHQNYTSLKVLFKSKILFATALTISTGACVSIDQPVPEPRDEPVTVLTQPKFSAEPLTTASRSQIMFAQSALTKLGYKIGPVDGIWGPKSATAIRSFEEQSTLKSAKGFLSELNINELSAVSGLKFSTFAEKSRNRNDIRSKLKGKLSDTGPQLIIIENDYPVFTEANPYSKQVLTLQAGAGIYIVSEQEGWYQIESFNGRKGYIQED